ncbi:MAG: nucleoside monophosphate kinase [Candidatus Spechtbacterales bacterium]
MKPDNAILIGRSGSGKGTQAELLIKKIDNFFTLSTGDLFRDLAKQNSDAGQKIKDIVNSGGLPYDDIATALWMHELSYNLRSDQGLLADGFPRRLNEAKTLDKYLEFLERMDRTFIFLVNISADEARRRLLARGREDDTEEAIKERMNYYDKWVMEVVEYYDSMGKLIKINGEGAPEKVHEEIMSHLS